MASIRLQGIEKTFPNGPRAVCGVDLELADGEFVVLVGPSGCGKSTVLRIVAGLETPTEGRVFIGPLDVTDWPPQQRDIAMVFQNYALYPHKNVRENLAFGLRMRGVRRELIAQRVQKTAATLGLAELLDRRPAQLSGGQRQRVALGRAIVREPKAFLLDEPLSNLDAKLRVQTRAELARMHRQLRATMLYVTHDQEEAMTLGDRVAVLLDGSLQQVGPPMEIYRRPANTFVAGFIGSPSMNFFPCTLQHEEGKLHLQSRAFTLPLDMTPPSTQHSVLLGVRPHDIRLAAADEADTTARVDLIEPLGSELLVHLAVPAPDGVLRIVAVAPPETALAVDDRAGLRFSRDRLHLFNAQSGTRLN
jgi:multiple sugar transport system ATP-binding protein